MKTLCLLSQVFLTLQKPVMEEAFAIPTSQIYPASNLSLDFK